MTFRAAFSLSREAPLVRYLFSLAENAVWVVLGLLAAALFVLALRYRWPRTSARWPYPLVLALFAAGAVVYAYELAWLSDDAFISFRYARNWIEGHGLVYNPGERVEGYTNFLWTALTAGGLLVGLEPASFVTALSLASLAGSVVLSGLLVWRLMPEGSGRAFSFAALALATNHTFASFGTSGLETMAGTLLVLVALERALAGAILASGSAGVAATLMHPDHALLYGALGVALASLEPKNRRRLALYAAPFLLGFLPYYLLRWAYYGDFFPNTYYAKSGGDAYFSQGVVYLWVSGLAASAVAALPLALVGVNAHKDRLAGRFVAIGVPLYLVYVAKIGGDFMLGRLLCPVLPLIFVMAELGVRELLNRPERLRHALAGLALFALPALPNTVVKPNEKYLHIADEGGMYRVTSFDPLVVDNGFDQEARLLAAVYQGAPRPPRLGVGCIGIVGYATDYPIMDNWGLANRSVAHMPIRRRGRPGHEKLATPGHAFEHDVDISDIGIWPAPYADWVKFDIQGWPFELVKYDPPLVRTLARHKVRVPALDRRIRSFMPNLRGPAELACDHWFFEQIYFSHELAAPADREAQTAREVLLGRFRIVDPTLGEVADLLFGAPGLREKRWKGRTLFDFEKLAGFRLEGNAFATDPVKRELPGQARAFGSVGHYVSSLEVREFDRATGRLLSPAFELQGDAITLLVSGGLDLQKVAVRLLVDGQAVRQATGCNSEVFGRRIWSTSALRGKRAQIEIVDHESGDWSHINVDQIVEWTRVSGGA